MENSNEKLIIDFFIDNKKEISNDGFSEKVMISLPEKKYNSHWIIPVFSLIGFYLTFLLVDVKKIILDLRFLLAGINPVYFITSIIIIPFIALIMWYAYGKKYQIFS